jgi:hypothetical protein
VARTIADLPKKLTHQVMVRLRPRCVVLECAPFIRCRASFYVCAS